MINFDNLKVYNDYKEINGEDILEFMKTKPRADIDEFKAFCAAPKTTTRKDGTVVERATNFFEMRNWVLDKYYPGLTARREKDTHRLIDDVMAL